jgi:CheY-like chemotaxis protein
MPSTKILTVDDSKTVRMIVKKTFEPFDCQVIEAVNGVEGLELASSEKPDLIILDITMPDINGIEMLERLKSESSLKNIPVIMLTAIKSSDKLVQIVKMGINDYIEKPFEGDQLIESTKRFVNLEAAKP